MGFVSKNDMGERKMAIAMRSCNFREACMDCTARISPDRPARLPRCMSRQRLQVTADAPVTRNDASANYQETQIGGIEHTSMEQKIQSTSVCTTIMAALPTPNAA